MTDIMFLLAFCPLGITFTSPSGYSIHLFFGKSDSMTPYSVLVTEREQRLTKANQRVLGV